MITIPAGVRIYLACGVTDMRRGFDGLSIMAQDVLKQDPFSGALFCFRGRRGDLVKVLYWDGQGFCLFAKRLEKGRFTWPNTKEGSVTRRRSCRCLWKGWSGERRDQRGSRRWRDDSGHRAGVTIRLAFRVREADMPTACRSSPSNCPMTSPS